MSFFGSISAALYLLLKVNLKCFKFIFFIKKLSLHLLSFENDEDYYHKQSKAFNDLQFLFFSLTNFKISELQLSILDCFSERITIDTPNFPA